MGECKVKKIAAMILSSMMAVSFVSGCSNGKTGASVTTDDDSKVLIMGTSADYKPFEFIDTAVSSEIIGFDVDLANYIAEELGYELEVRDMDFNSLLTALQTDKVDIVLAGMTPTEERKEVVDFSDIYFTAKNVVITTTDSGIESLEDINGKVLGAQTGSIQQTAVEEMQESGLDVTLETRERMPNLIQEILSGRIDGVVIEDMVTANYLEANDNLKIADVLEEADNGSAIALPKGSDLTEQINEIIAEMKENGKMDELVNKWFNE